jgi:cytochrome c oxidase subunit 3
MLVAGTLILGTLFVVFQWVGFNWMWDHGVRLRGASAGQFLYIIAGLHALHVIGGIVVLIVMFLKAFFGKNRSYNATPVDVAATYWHFVDALWLYLLVFFMVVG